MPSTPTSASTIYPSETEKPTRRPRVAPATRYLVRGAILVSAIGITSLLCLIYLLIGHSILLSAGLSGYSAPLSSSVRAGAVGGAIIAIPLTLILLFLFPKKQEAPEDFFDDDDSRVGYRPLEIMKRWHLNEVLAALLGLFLAVIGGPLGVTALRHSEGHKVLDAAHAARAGAVGGIIGGPALFLFILGVTTLWSAGFFQRWRTHTDESTS